MSKIQKADLPTPVRELWDRYNAVLTAVGPHNAQVQRILPYRRLVGHWGGFIKSAVETQSVPPSVARVHQLIGQVIKQLDQLEGRVKTSVQPSLVNFQSAIAPLAA